MSMPNTRFRISFGGKYYPDYRPTSVTIRSQSKKIAEEWAVRQLDAWGLDPEKVKFEISQIEDPPESKPPESKFPEESPKKAKRNKVKSKEKT